MPAKLTRVAETSVSVGTGDFVLTGAATTKFGPTIRGFAGVAGSGVNGYLFFYTILHDTLNEYEDGIGYMSDATTLVRHRVMRSSSANAAVNFSAGDKLVMCADQGALMDAYFGGSNSATVSTKWQIPNNQNGTSSTVAMVASRLYLVPFIVTNKMSVSEFMVSVTTAVTGAVIYAALCERISRTEFRVVSDLGSVDASTSGDKVFTATNVNVPAGTYFMAVISNSTPTVRGRGLLWADLGSSFGTATQWLYGGGVAGTWPNLITGITLSVNNTNAPSIMYRTMEDYE